MKAIVQDSYGSPDILQLKDVERPVPGDDQVLVKVHAAGINPMDWRLLRADPAPVRLVMGLRKPRAAIPGADVAGVVEAVGADVTGLSPGDEVYGEISRGCLAEYVSASAERLARKPTKLTFEQAAAVPMAALTALQGLRDAGRIEEGQKVLINGAAGGVGSFAVQLAKALGAAEVTGVCGTDKVELVLSIGAGHAIDYTKEDFTRSGQRYDLLLDTVGNHSLRALRRALTRKGTLVLVGGGGGHLLGPYAQILRGKLLKPFVSQRIVDFLCRSTREDMAALNELIEAGKLKPLIDRVYPLAEAPEAIRYLEQGHAGGKVIVSVST